MNHDVIHNGFYFQGLQDVSSGLGSKYELQKGGSVETCYSQSLLQRVVLAVM